ncbi:ExbD/TolR family protein [Pseudophaeobacter sp. TrK17]|jgi:biopolymer transport protein ExbD|uniref:ExbD/TolR family protein n=1 Tax=Pseudophaeobacter sp. TrK17 TaxID=2815167 RepID=UPI00220ED5FA|nr:biopolymer transporter ExbD [Phaeobacter sp. G2]
MIRRPRIGRKRDSTITLINVVFLMLIFFLIAGTVAPPLDSNLQLVETSGLEGREPPDALVLHQDGRLSFRGAVTDPQTYMADHGAKPVRIVPDRAVPGARLIEVTGALRRLGAPGVFLVTVRSLE